MFTDQPSLYDHWQVRWISDYLVTMAPVSGRDLSGSRWTLCPQSLCVWSGKKWAAWGFERLWPNRWSFGTVVNTYGALKRPLVDSCARAFVKQPRLTIKDQEVNRLSKSSSKRTRRSTPPSAADQTCSEPPQRPEAAPTTERRSVPLLLFATTPTQPASCHDDTSLVFLFSQY